MKSLFQILILFFLAGFIEPDSPFVWVDDFELYKINSFPSDWSGRKNEAAHYYHVSKDSAGTGQKYLSVVNDQTDMFILKKIEVDLAQYPYLNWKWRVNQLPVGGDESEKNTCDVPASINVVLVAKKWKPKTIKYTWSTQLKKNTITKSPFAFWPSRCDIVVLQSGNQLKGEWVNEKRNVLEDYKMFYNKENVKSKVIQAIVIMSDGDNTKSISAADYDEIYFSKN